jgi:hypothetical protein
MKRIIHLNLNKVIQVPESLRRDPKVNEAAATLSVDLGRLFHHYYFDSYNSEPPDPDPTSFEYLRFLSATPEFRFKDKGPGASSGKRRSISTELGQAFCRFILHDHFGIRYFAHMDRVLDRPSHSAWDGMQVVRILDGDAPDYLCAELVTKPMLAEAKGRFRSVSFASNEFQEWRGQFSRVQVRDKMGVALRVKGVHFSDALCH